MIEQAVRHIVDPRQLSRDFVLEQIERCACMEDLSNLPKSKRKEIGLLDGRNAINLFAQKSTGTLATFERAQTLLLMDRQTYYGENSSLEKQESFASTIRRLNNCQPDVYVIRAQGGAWVEEVLAETRVPLIVAGSDFHPSQGMQDFALIGEQTGSIDGHNIMLVGPILREVRVAETLVILAASISKNTHIDLISHPGFELSERARHHLDTVGLRNGVSYSLNPPIKEAARRASIAYGVRPATEMITLPKGIVMSNIDFKSPNHTIDGEVLELMPSDAIAMEALPAGDDFPEQFHKHSKSRIQRQAQMGLFMRMALLTELVS